KLKGLWRISGEARAQSFACFAVLCVFALSIESCAFTAQYSAQRRKGPQTTRTTDQVEPNHRVLVFSRQPQMDRCWVAARIGYASSADNTHVKQRNPILDGLQRQADEEQGYTEDSHALGGNVNDYPFDKGRCGESNKSHRPDTKSQAQCHGQSGLALIRDQGAYPPSDRVTNCSIQSRKDLKLSQTRTRGWFVVHCRTEAKFISNDLSRRAECAERNSKFDPI